MSEKTDFWLFFIAGMTFGISIIGLNISILLKQHLHYWHTLLCILSLVGLIYGCMIIFENIKK